MNKHEMASKAVLKYISLREYISLRRHIPSTDVSYNESHRYVTSAALIDPQGANLPKSFAPIRPSRKEPDSVSILWRFWSQGYHKPDSPNLPFSAEEIINTCVTQ